MRSFLLALLLLLSGCAEKSELAARCETIVDMDVELDEWQVLLGVRQCEDTRGYGGLSAGETIGDGCFSFAMREAIQRAYGECFPFLMQGTDEELQEAKREFQVHVDRGLRGESYSEDFLGVDTAPLRSLIAYRTREMSQDTFNWKIADYSSSIDLNEDLASNLFDRGMLFYFRGKVELAVVDFDISANLDPDAALLKVGIYGETFKGPDGEEKPDPLGISVMSSMLLNRVQRRNAACWRLALIGQYATAKVLCDLALAEAPDMAEAWDSRALANWGLGQDKLALQDLAEAHRLDNNGGFEPSQRIKAFPVLVSQNLLKLAGNYDGPADGKINAETVEAISTFQREYGLTITGEFSNELQQSLLLYIWRPVSISD